MATIEDIKQELKEAKKEYSRVGKKLDRSKEVKRVNALLEDWEPRVKGEEELEELKEEIKGWRKTVQELQCALAATATLAVASGVSSDNNKLAVTSSRENQLLDEAAELKALLNRFQQSSYEFNLVIKPNRVSATKWIVNIDTVTLEELESEVVAKDEEFDNNLSFNIETKNGDKYAVDTNGKLQRVLRQLVVKNITTLTVSRIASGKAFSDWKFREVCLLYGIGPDLSAFPKLTCGYVDVNKPILSELMVELNKRTRITPLLEAGKSIYAYSILCAAALHHEEKFMVIPEKYEEGRNGRGPVDYGMVDKDAGVTVAITEVKENDFLKGIGQNAVQLEAALTGRKRKASVMDKCGIRRCFGIVTDAEKWYFLECTLDDDGNPNFKLSHTPISVSYGIKYTESMVENVLGHIVWLLAEAEKITLIQPSKKAKNSPKFGFSGFERNW